MHRLLFTYINISSMSVFLQTDFVQFCDESFRIRQIVEDQIETRRLVTGYRIRGYIGGCSPEQMFIDILIDRRTKKDSRIYGLVPHDPEAVQLS